MKEVHVVLHPDGDVMGVYSTREKAEVYVRAWRDAEIADNIPPGFRRSEEAQIEVYPIDPEAA